MEGRGTALGEFHQIRPRRSRIQGVLRVLGVVSILAIATFVPFLAVGHAQNRTEPTGNGLPSQGEVRVSAPATGSMYRTNSARSASAESPAAYSGEYVEGVYYSGASTTSATVQADITVPHDTPPSTDYYYVVVSAWDNSDSYDMIGFANNHGTWQVAYLATSPCPVGQTSFPPALSSQHLTPGLTYLFTMTASSGAIDFTVFYSSNATTLWSTAAATGGSYFELENTFTCTSGTSGLSSHGYFDYEDVRAASNTVPPYNFYLQTDVSQSWTSFSAGVPTSGPVSGMGVWFSNNEVDLIFANEQAFTQPASGSGSMTLEAAPQTQIESFGVDVYLLGADSNNIMLLANVPSAFTNFVITPSSGSPPFTSTVSYSIPAATAPGSYDIQVVAFDGTGSYNRYSYYVDILPALSVSPMGTPGSGGVDVGQSVTFSPGVNGGSGGYAYTWSGDLPGCPSSSGASLTCSPTAAGTFTVTVSVTDSLGYSTSSSIQYRVFPVPAVTSFTVSAPQITEGQSVQFAVVASQGSGQLAYVWQGLPIGCSTADTSTLTCVPSATGTWAVSVAVSDSNHGIALSTPLTLTVVASGNNHNGTSSNGTGTSQNGTGSSGFFSGYFSWVVIGVLVMAVVALSVIVIRMRRKGKSGT